MEHQNLSVTFDVFYSLQKNDDDYDDTQEMSYEEILNISESDDARLYFYPGVQVTYQLKK